ncbi:hypothetical protein [Polaribacter sargassicola]|uniref:hypothetical protein n=1 Tax=Polaribacter sargassicola TaxID=2836891 RepID=UPI001F298D76|nr:hypothetical protein [Polaribacter sp. DS7-9]MCG1036968.1 hypothetical protein [Polaribacter sp. DS7-9]
MNLEKLHILLCIYILLDALLSSKCMVCLFLITNGVKNASKNLNSKTILTPLFSPQTTLQKKQVSMVSIYKIKALFRPFKKFDFFLNHIFFNT